MKFGEGAGHPAYHGERLHSNPPSVISPYSHEVHVRPLKSTSPGLPTDQTASHGATVWTIAMLLLLVGGCFIGLYLTKPIYYELYALANPMHDAPMGISPSPESRKELSSVTEDMEDLMLNQRQQESADTEVEKAHSALAHSALAPPPPSPAITVVGQPERPATQLKIAPAPSLHQEERFSEEHIVPSDQVEAVKTKLGEAEAEPQVVEAIEPLGLNLTPCQEKKRRMKQLTEEVQAALFALNHPSNCAAAPLLECDSGQGLDQGTGSRLFFLTRCLAKCMDMGRTCVLNPNMKGTEEMLSPFLPWSNCTMKDVAAAKKKGRGQVVTYGPKSMPDIDIVDGVKGGLVPKQYAELGYFWWKAQEILYALRPTEATKKALAEHKIEIGWPSNGAPVHGMQVRRTDKVEGKYKEAEKVPLGVYAAHLVNMTSKSIPPDDSAVKTVLLASDDTAILNEAAPVSKQHGLKFLRNSPAPKRTIGVFKGRELKDALDILSLADTDILVFTYSSGFGALAFLSKLARDGYCTNWISVDQGKREWPKWTLIGNGGHNGVPKGSKWSSNLCRVSMEGKEKIVDNTAEYHCTMWVKNIAVDNHVKKQRGLVSQCDC